MPGVIVDIFAQPHDRHRVREAAGTPIEANGIAGMVMVMHPKSETGS